MGINKTLYLLIPYSIFVTVSYFVYGLIKPKSNPRKGEDIFKLESESGTIEFYYPRDNFLVLGGAGSGKTAVLVQRILSKIMDSVKPVDIDILLIMTYTREAAGEMNERIERALDQALAEDPDNEHLQRQMTLIHTAQITTIDGFCSYVIRNYFHLI